MHLYNRDLFVDFGVFKDENVPSFPQNIHAIKFAYVSKIVPIYVDLLKSGKLMTSSGSQINR